MSAVQRSVLLVLLAVSLPVGVGAQAPAASGDPPVQRALNRVGTVAPPTSLRAPARLRIERVSLHEALEALHHSTSAPLLFSPTLVPTLTVSCICDALTIDEALATLLRGTDLEFAQRSGQILVRVRRVVAPPARAPRARLVADQADAC